MMRGASFLTTLACAACIFAVPASAQSQPAADDQSTHSAPWPGLGAGQNQQEVTDSLKLAPELRRDIPAKEMLRERRKLDRALAALQPQSRGQVDAYVVSIALDSDAVFGREAREAGRVLARRYGAHGRTLVLAGARGGEDVPKGSISALTIALAAIAEKMDPAEDVLVLYSTSHGIPQGATYHYGDEGFGVLSPQRLKAVLEDLGIKRRILMISACYSGVFVPELASRDTAILTASAANRTSFGCAPGNDWTFFGDALINRAMRKPQSLEQASQEANLSIAGWEARKRLSASLPQIAVGAGVADWIGALDAQTPRLASAPVGRPAVGE